MEKPIQQERTQQLMSTEEEDEKEKSPGILGKIKSIFSKKEEEEEEEDKMVDSINNYLESSIDTPEIKDIDEEDIQKIDNLLVDHKSLVDGNNQIEGKFQKYKESQRIKGFKDSTLMKQKEEEIRNLTNIVLKLEKSLRKYKKNAEKKFIAQNELHSKELRKELREQDKENHEVYDYMNKVFNEKIKKANIIIKGIQNDSDYVFNETHMEKKIIKKKKSKKKSTKKKKSIRKKSIQKRKKKRKASKNRKRTKKKI